MSELGQHGAYLSERAEQAVIQVARLYSSALDAAYPDLKLSHESQAKKEVELLAAVAITTAVRGGMSFRELVTEFVGVAYTAYKEDEDEPF